MKKIAIILTTFLRDNLMKQSVQSILDNWQENYELFVLDQGHKNKEKLNWFKERGFNCLDIGSENNKHYWELPWDCGLSLARNFGVQQANRKQCSYCLITADSIIFKEKYNFEDIIDFMEIQPIVGIVGFELEKRIPWECTLEIKDNSFYFDK